MNTALVGLVLKSQDLKLMSLLVSTKLFPRVATVFELSPVQILWLQLQDLRSWRYHHLANYSKGC